MHDCVSRHVFLSPWQPADLFKTLKMVRTRFVFSVYCKEFSSLSSSSSSSLFYGCSAVCLSTCVWSQHGDFTHSVGSKSPFRLHQSTVSSRFPSKCVCISLSMCVSIHVCLSVCLRVCLQVCVCVCALSAVFVHEPGQHLLQL